MGQEGKQKQKESSFSDEQDELDSVGEFISFTSYRGKNTPQQQAQEIWSTQIFPKIKKGERVAILYAANEKQAQKLIAARTSGEMGTIIHGHGLAPIFSFLEKKIAAEGLQNDVVILPIATSLRGGKKQKNNVVSKEILERDLGTVAYYLGAGFNVLALEETKENKKRFAIGGGQTKWMHKVYVTITEKISYTQDQFIQDSLMRLKTKRDISDFLYTKLHAGKRQGTPIAPVSANYVKYPNLLIHFFEGKATIHAYAFKKWFVRDPHFTFTQWLNCTDWELANYKNYLPALFPVVNETTKAPTMPSLTKELNQYLIKNPQIQQQAAARMLAFYGLKLTKNDDVNNPWSITLADNFAKCAEKWMQRSEMNYQRISQIIWSLQQNGNQPLAQAIAQTFIKINNLTPNQFAHIEKVSLKTKSQFNLNINFSLSKVQLQLDKNDTFTTPELTILQGGASSSPPTLAQASSSSLVGLLQQQNSSPQIKIDEALQSLNRDHNQVLIQKYKLMEIVWHLKNEADKYAYHRKNSSSFAGQKNVSWADKISAEAVKLWDELAQQQNPTTQEIAEKYQKITDLLTQAHIHHHKSALNFFGLTHSRFEKRVITQLTHELDAYHQNYLSDERNVNKPAVK